MRERGFWSTDSESKRREDIDAAQDQLDALEKRNELVERQLRKQVQQLAMTVEVLLDILEEKAVIDPAELDQRLAQLSRPAPTPPSPTAFGDPYRGIAAPPPPAIPDLLCSRCDQMVAAAATQMTALGVVCDRCMARPRP